MVTENVNGLEVEKSKMVLEPLQEKDKDKDKDKETHGASEFFEKIWKNKKWTEARWQEGFLRKQYARKECGKVWNELKKKKKFRW